MQHIGRDAAGGLLHLYMLMHQAHQIPFGLVFAVQAHHLVAPAVRHGAVHEDLMPRNAEAVVRRAGNQLADVGNGAFLQHLVAIHAQYPFALTQAHGIGFLFGKAEPILMHHARAVATGNVLRAVGRA